MSSFTQGCITIDLPETLTLPEKAGKLTVAEVRRLPKPRSSLPLVCDAVAESMRKNPDRLCPHGVTADGLQAAGSFAELINGIVTDLSTTMSVISQSDVILSAEAHVGLRKVLAFVRGQEKFDPRIANLVPELIDYFSHRSSGRVEDESSSTSSSVAA